LKNSVKIKNILFKSGLYPHSNYFSKGKYIGILRYHSILNSEHNDYVSPNIALPVDVFERQIQYFSKKYNVISMDEVADCLRNHRPFPKRAVAITFDDGYRDNFAAYRILRKYGISGTFYVVAGCVGQGEPLWLFEIIYLIRITLKKKFDLDVFGQTMALSIASNAEKGIAIRKVTEIIKSNNRLVREDVRRQLRSQLSDVTDLDERAFQIMLTWEQLREMSDNNMIIGGHTMTHLNLPNADTDDARREINDCKHLLEEKLQKPVLHFSYPNGGNYAYYNQTILTMVKEAGYFTSTTSNNGLADLNANEFELNRIRVTPNLPEIYYQMEWEPIVNKLMKKVY
jgi:peptidoglycan/xylan/chitin deacetylase (PgdA/CDA1 family)